MIVYHYNSYVMQLLTSDLKKDHDNGIRSYTCSHGRGIKTTYNFV